MIKISIDSNVAFADLEKSIYEALLTYSNVHRGSGFKSMITTKLYEEARNVVLEYLSLDKKKHLLVFGSPSRMNSLKKQLSKGNFHEISSKQTGLPLGVSALAIERGKLPKGTPMQTGGGSAKLISRDWIIWAAKPDKFEAGTPQIINVIAFAKALSLMKTHGETIFSEAINTRNTINDLFYSDDYPGISGKLLLNEIRKSIIGKDYQVPSCYNETSFINLDNSASTPTFEPVWETFSRTLRVNKSSHNEIAEEVKHICSQFLSAPLSTYDILFTANTTESINLVAENHKNKGIEGDQPVILSTMAEHSSNDLPWRMLENYSLERLTIEPNGIIDLNKLETILSEYNETKIHGNKRIRLVALNGASNVLGTCHNIKSISKIVHQYGAKLMIDAAQLVAHRKIETEPCDIDYLALSGHKIYAPFGCGLLIAKKELLDYSNEVIAEVQEQQTENIAGIAALGKAFEIISRIGIDTIEKDERALTKQLIDGLAKINGTKVYGLQNTSEKEFADKLGVIAFTLKSKMADRIAKELSLNYGIGIRSGCHCAHILVKHILGVNPGLEKFQRIMQTLIPKIQFPGVARVSLGIENTPEEIERFLYAIDHISGNATNSQEQFSTSEIKEKIEVLINRKTKLVLQ